jgi:hypothetical protein
LLTRSCFSARGTDLKPKWVLSVSSAIGRRCCAFPRRDA